MAVTTKLDVLPHTLNLDFFKETKLTGRSTQQGYNYFTLAYIHSVILCEISANEVDIKAKCYKSMRKNETPHNVNITVLKEEKKISDSNCSCVAGLSGTCSHVIGLVYTIAHYQNLGLKEVPAELSATSLPQEWHKPRGRKIKPMPVVSMTRANPTKSPADRKRKPIFTPAPVETVNISIEQIKKLKEDSNIPLSYLLQDNASMISTRIGDVQKGSSLYFHLKHYKETKPVTEVTPCGVTVFPISTLFTIDENYKICNEFIPINYEDAISLEKNTVRQFNSLEWINQRKERLTASNFGKILKRKKEVNEKFLQAIFHQKQFTSAATSYGTANEVTAKEKYVEMFPQKHIHDCGLVVNPEFSFLGATPDGKVCSNSITGVIEIKCPYSVRDMTIDQALDNPNFCLKENGDVYNIKEDHDYFYQVQGQLMITGAPYCEFIVYTKEDLKVVKILSNRNVQQDMLSKLCEFYKTHAMPYLQNIRNKVPVPSV